MRTYEGLFIFPVEEKGKSFDEREKAVQAVIKKHGGSVGQKTDLGKKALGYIVKKNKEGRLLVCDISIDPAKMGSLRNDLELAEDAIKYTITLKNPSLQKEAGAPEKEKKPVKAAAVNS